MCDQITVKDLERAIEIAFELKKQHAEEKAVASATYAALESQKQTVIGMLETLGKTSYKSDNGTFSYKEEYSYRVPKDLASRDLFFKHLRDKGIFEEMITVNSRTLNSWAKLEEIAAEKEGNIDYQVPGIEKSEPSMKASMRGK